LYQKLLNLRDLRTIESCAGWGPHLKQTQPKSSKTFHPKTIRYSKIGPTILYVSSPALPAIGCGIARHPGSAVRRGDGSTAIVREGLRGGYVPFKQKRGKKIQLNLKNVILLDSQSTIGSSLQPQACRRNHQGKQQDAIEEQWRDNAS
jgi:hypothetical protein